MPSSMIARMVRVSRLSSRQRTTPSAGRRLTGTESQERWTKAKKAARLRWTVLSRMRQRRSATRQLLMQLLAARPPPETVQDGRREVTIEAEKVSSNSHKTDGAATNPPSDVRLDELDPLGETVLASSPAGPDTVFQSFESAETRPQDAQRETDTAMPPASGAQDPTAQDGQLASRQKHQGLPARERPQHHSHCRPPRRPNRAHRSPRRRNLDQRMAAASATAKPHLSSPRLLIMCSRVPGGDPRFGVLLRGYSILAGDGTRLEGE